MHDCPRGAATTQGVDRAVASIGLTNSHHPAYYALMKIPHFFQTAALLVAGMLAPCLSAQTADSGRTRVLVVTGGHDFEHDGKGASSF